MLLLARSRVDEDALKVCFPDHIHLNRLTLDTDYSGDMEGRATRMATISLISPTHPASIISTWNCTRWLKYPQHNHVTSIHVALEVVQLLMNMILL